MSNQRSRWEGENQKIPRPRPHPHLRVLYKKHLLGRILWSSKWLSLREKAQLHCIDAQKSEFVVCVGWGGGTIEKSTAPFHGWVVEEGRKQRSRWASGKRRTEVCVSRTGAHVEEPSWLSGEKRLGPHRQDHQERRASVIS